jgi:hypothetical protein
MEKLTKEDCEKWKNNPLKNPLTSRAIQEGKGVYNQLKALCDKLLISSPKKEKQIDEKKQEEKETDCEQWRKNKTINPQTGKKLIKGKGPYKSWEEKCQSPKVRSRSPKEKQTYLSKGKLVSILPKKMSAEKETKSRTPSPEKKQTYISKGKLVSMSPKKLSGEKETKSRTPSPEKKQTYISKGTLISSPKKAPKDLYSKSDSRNCQDYDFQMLSENKVQKFLHLCNFCKGKYQLIYPENINKYNKTLSLTLNKELPSLPYYQRKEIYKTVKHAGQRKLLMAELELLTAFFDKYPNKNKVVIVYVGAGPGHHLEILVPLFKQFIYQWVLYDPVFYKSVYPPLKKLEKLRTEDEERPYVDLRGQYFKDEDAEYIRKTYTDEGYEVIFISDIRRKEGFGKPTEKEVYLDMVDQKKWYEIINPIAGQLKFRLPWEEGTTEYLKGTIYLPIWGPQQTTESRLTIFERNPSIVKYNNKAYESKMFYFNTKYRVSLYEIPEIYTSLENYCHCFDCTAEIEVLRRVYAYCKKKDRFLEPKSFGGMKKTEKETIFNWVNHLEDYCFEWKKRGGDKEEE